VFVVELDLAHLEEAAPPGLVSQTILERRARVLLSNEELYRNFGERRQPLVNDRWFGRFDEGGATRGDPSRCAVLSAAAGEEAEQRENHDDDDDPDDDAEDAPPLVRTFLPSCFDGNPFRLAVSRQ
jgi:hypothetical protein